MFEGDLFIKNFYNSPSNGLKIYATFLFLEGVFAYHILTSSHL